MKCKLCNKTAEVEKGFLNIAAIMVPLCADHMKEYIQFKNETWERME